MALDNLRGGTKRVVEENTPLNNLRGGTKRVVIVDGGGGSVDYAKTVQRAETMPTADSSNAGQQFLYSGESDATYTHGYIYENVATTTSSSASAEQTVGSTLSDIAVDLATLESFTGWTTDNSLQIFYTADGWSVDATSLGVTYTGTPNVGDAITITYTAESTSYAWTQIDVQPAPEALPDQTGQSGKFLTTDGTDASWSDKPLVNNSSSAGGLSVLNSIGGAQAVRIGEAGSYQVNKDNVVTIGYKNTAGDTGVIAIGRYAAAAANNNAADSIAIGHFATTTYGGTASNGAVSIGGHAYTTGNRAIAIGCYANANATGAIQLGTSSTSASTTNSDANTFKVANANGNFEIMSADGTVPTARLTKVNTTTTLAVADWSSSTQTVTVSGVKADSVVFVSPAPASASDYASAGILCTSQSAGTLTFTATTTPSVAIDVNIVCL